MMQAKTSSALADQAMLKTPPSVTTRILVIPHEVSTTKNRLGVGRLVQYHFS
jgi:hypothetical protein